VLLQFTEHYNLDGTESLAKRRDFRKGEGMHWQPLALQGSCTATM
jgi:hypothetical protein